MADLGLDLAGVDDITPSLAPATGRTALMQSIARRLITPRGARAIYGDADYGYDVRQHLSAAIVSPSQIAASVEAEAEKDERVAPGAQARIGFASGVLSVQLLISDDEGPFAFTLNVNAVTAQLLLQGPS